jgi:glycosyltransferase involved in cell wall biosynthesis
MNMKCFMVTPYPPERCGIAIYSSKLVAALRSHLNITVVGNKDSCRTTEVSRNLKIIRSWKRNSMAYVVEIVKEVTHEPPQVIHIQHEYLGYGSPMCGLLFPLLLVLLRLFGRPIILTMHSVIRRSSLTDSFFSLHRTGRRFAPMKKLVMIVFTKVIATLCDAIIVHSEEMKATLIRDYFIRNAKIFVVFHGTDTYLCRRDSAETRRRLGLQNKKIVLFFGFIIPNKGIEILLKAFPAVSAKIPDLVLVIAGGYHPRLGEESPEYIGTVEKMIDELKLQERIVFENRHVPDDLLELYISAADVIVFPYVDDSVVGASGALATCAGMGRSVVATRLPRFSSDIKDEYDGLLAEPNNEQDLILKMMTILEQDSLRESLGQHLREKAQARSWQIIALQTYELYKRITCEKI